jgi:hypothetical protein
VTHRQRKALVLKEEGVPVFELELKWVCANAWHGHVTVNNAATDIVTVAPWKQSCSELSLYPAGFSGSRIENRTAFPRYGSGRRIATVFDRKVARP